MGNPPRSCRKSTRGSSSLAQTTRGCKAHAAGGRGGHKAGHTRQEKASSVKETGAGERCKLRKLWWVSSAAGGWADSSAAPRSRW
jgi:hypothetical protein